MKTSGIFLLISVLLWSCRSQMPSSNQLKDEPILTESDSVWVTLTAQNLSEDMSLFSTHNDEILFFIYVENDSALADPIFTIQTIFDANHATQRIFWDSDSNLQGKSVFLVLIEQDDDLPIDHLDSIIRNHKPQIIRDFKANAYSSIRSYLGDEDVLGVRVVSLANLNEPIEIRMYGIHKADTYEYQIQIKK